MVVFELPPNESCSENKRRKGATMGVLCLKQKGELAVAIGHMARFTARNLHKGSYDIAK